MTDLTQRAPKTTTTITPAVTLQLELRLSTVVALGGVVACSLLALQDPILRARCLKIAKDQRLRQALLDLTRDPANVHHVAGRGIA